MEFDMDHDVLKQWNSCPAHLNLPVVPPGKIRKIHIYDFDNTLYNSPHPNRQLFSKTFIKDVLLKQDLLPSGNWWSDEKYLRVSFEESKKPSDHGEIRSFWNDKVIKLAKQSCAAEDTITLVLTGRKEEAFSSLIEEMLSSKFLDSKFNAVCLKKKFSPYSNNTNKSDHTTWSTSNFKLEIFNDFMNYYQDSLQEITVYEDRGSHVRIFEHFFSQTHLYPLHLNKRTFNWYVIPVPPTITYLPPALELQKVKESIEKYNLDNLNTPIKIKWSPLQTGFFLTTTSQKKLVSWTTSHFHYKQPKMWVYNIYDYPAYIPCVERGSQIEKKEIVKLWTNNNRKALSDSAAIDMISEKFYARLFSASDSRKLILEFKITEVGVVKLKDPQVKAFGNIRIAKNSIFVIYKLEPQSKSKYTYTKFPYLTIIGSSSKYASFEEEMLYDLIFDTPEANIVWSKVPQPVRITTYFGQYSKVIT
ncbi:hypothetical protein TPHA_0G00990 [Tetrapisispora phaffii CBS 4417]|uniref:Uncharacterized protein n=1 Tax=Tetrapisispora phaffii (strain ATCC 24235 / CBS 4417 / NBRC 1672 / NRRL Y-8282 / UCD 70-5) TaxID=1071381 RepID=G8BVK7_TETPH|nr:hypothetical protein TPHA_0G00990 [Tetrapisispora phaffii CBS 4417]CCE63935.1 hypothetical protein TPHA_0G00990 [Tetrapisispora phaffii CBS 4417]